jgi:hypothetical protein
VIGVRLRRHEPLAAELNDFVGAVRDGVKPTVTGHDGLETLYLAHEFLKSGRTAEISFQHDELAHAQ